MEEGGRCYDRDMIFLRKDVNIGLCTLNIITIDGAVFSSPFFAGSPRAEQRHDVSQRVIYKTHPAAPCDIRCAQPRMARESGWSRRCRRAKVELRAWFGAAAEVFMMRDPSRIGPTGITINSTTPTARCDRPNTPKS
jgi:hypothetical protein